MASHETVSNCPYIQSNNLDRIKSALSYKVEYPPAVSAVVVIQQVNELFADAADYKNYHFIKSSARYVDDVASKLDKVANKTVVQMKDQTFSCKEPMSLNAFLGLQGTMRHMHHPQAGSYVALQSLSKRFRRVHYQGPCCPVNRDRHKARSLPHVICYYRQLFS